MLKLKTLSQKCFLISQSTCQMVIRQLSNAQTSKLWLTPWPNKAWIFLMDAAMDFVGSVLPNLLKGTCQKMELESSWRKNKLPKDIFCLARYIPLKTWKLLLIVNTSMKNSTKNEFELHLNYRTLAKLSINWMIFTFVKIYLLKIWYYW